VFELLAPSDLLLSSYFLKQTLECVIVSSCMLVSHYLNNTRVSLGDLNSMSSVEKLNSKEAFRLLDANSSELLEVLFISIEDLNSDLSLSLLVSELQSS